MAIWLRLTLITMTVGGGFAGLTFVVPTLGQSEELVTRYCGPFRRTDEIVAVLTAVRLCKPPEKYQANVQRPMKCNVLQTLLRR